MRKALIAGLAVLVLVAGTTIYLYSSLDSIVKGVLVEVGSKVTGSKLSVGSVHISLAEGKGQIGGVALANPPGFSANPAIRMDDVSLTLDKASLAGNVVVIKELAIRAPAIRYEIGAKGANLDQIRKALAAHKAGGGQPGAGRPAGKKLVIERLSITEGQVTLAVEGLPAESIKLADIQLTNIGRSSNGVEAAQLGEEMTAALLGGAARSVATLPSLLGKTGDQVKKLLPAEAGGLLKDLLGK